MLRRHLSQQVLSRQFADTTNNSDVQQHMFYFPRVLECCRDSMTLLWRNVISRSNGWLPGSKDWLPEAKTTSRKRTFASRSISRFWEVAVGFQEVCVCTNCTVAIIWHTSSWQKVCVCVCAHVFVTMCVYFSDQVSVCV